MRERITKQIIKDYVPYSSGIILASMRLGKTKLALDLINKNKPQSILWVTPNSGLRDIEIPREFRKWGYEKYLEKTKIVTYHILSKIVGDYDMIVLDEVQKVTPNNIQGLVQDGFRKPYLTYKCLVGLTGTMPKGLEKNTLLELLNLKVIAEVSMDEAIESDIISDFRVFPVGVSLDAITKNIKAGNKTKQFYQTEMNTYNWLTARIEEYHSKAPMWLIMKRLKLIYSLPSKHQVAKNMLKTIKGRTIVFCGNIEMAESMGIPTFHSQTSAKYLKAFQEGHINQIALVQSGGIGFTFTDVKNIILVQVDSNRTGNTLQKLGRGLVKKEDVAVTNIIALYARGTVDQRWLENFLDDIPNAKVDWRYNNL